MAENTIIDDTNPDVHFLPGYWDITNYSQSYGGGMHLTVILDATMTYTFTGSSITVSGALPPNEGVAAAAAFSVDGRYQSQFTAQYNGEIQWRVLLYSSGPLDGPGPHTLSLRNLRQDAKLWVDFFVIGPVDAGKEATTVSLSPGSPSSITSTARSRAAPTAPGVTSEAAVPGVPATTITTVGPLVPSADPSAQRATVFVSEGVSVFNLLPNATGSGALITSGGTVIAAPEATAQQEGMSSGTKSSPVPVIAGAIGGVLGGVAIIILLVFLLFRERRKRGRDRELLADDHDKSRNPEASEVFQSGVDTPTFTFSVQPFAESTRSDSRAGSLTSEKGRANLSPSPSEAGFGPADLQSNAYDRPPSYSVRL